MDDLAKKAERLRELHRPGRPLILPNAWDAASAAAVAEAGFPAVATASAAVSAVLGYPDGQGTPPAEMFASVARIAAASGSLPVTADLEAGYGLAANTLVDELLKAGAVGCNLEDSDLASGGLVPVATQAARLSEVRAAATAVGVPIVINARVDVYLRGGDGDPAELLAEALRRGRAYLEAGADCVYPILVREESAIASLVAEVGGPVNANAIPGGTDLARLAELGVARISYGPQIHGIAMAAVRERLASIASALAD